tara:strand:- start:174 stop:536 length:363 start_codon:yes stop_codon:yes gene_type:complete
MPKYDYECSGCEHQLIDVQQSFHDDALTTCPECGEEKLFRIVTGGIMAKVNNIDTIGKLADENSNKFKNQMEEAQHMQEEANPTPKAPWYHNPKYGSATNQEINKMTNSQKRRYIMEGRK